MHPTQLCVRSRQLAKALITAYPAGRSSRTYIRASRSSLVTRGGGKVGRMEDVGEDVVEDVVEEGGVRAARLAGFFSDPASCVRIYGAGTLGVGSGLRSEVV